MAKKDSIKIDFAEMGIKEITEAASVEDALSMTGFGKYNYCLLLVCSLMLQAMGMDLFGMSFTVTAAVCDLQLTMEQRGMLSAIPFIGVIAGAHLWGYFSDTRGRKMTLILSMGVGFIFASLSSLSPDWKTMAAMKFLSSCFTSATNSAAYTLLGESCPAQVRSRTMLLMTCALMMSQAMSAVLSYPILPLKLDIWIDFLGINFRSWRLLMVVLAAPCGITALLLNFFHESPKFLANQGQDAEALEVLKKIYASNTGDLPENFPVKKLIPENEKKALQTSLLASLWQQTMPLFQPPFLKRTLHLFYLVIIVYMTGSGFIMWLPYIMNNLFAVLESGAGAGMNICSVLDYAASTTLDRNATDNLPIACDATIQDTTIISAVTYGCMACAVNLIMSMVSGSHKKLAMIIILCVSGVSAILINLVPVSIAGVFFFFLFQFIALSMGILSVYFVELYPTSLRGMVSCLSVMVGRGSAFVGVNVIGTFLVRNCEATFYVWSCLVFSAVVFAVYLPSDRTTKK